MRLPLLAAETRTRCRTDASLARFYLSKMHLSPIPADWPVNGLFPRPLVALLWGRNVFAIPRLLFHATGPYWAQLLPAGREAACPPAWLRRHQLQSRARRGPTAA